MFGRFNKPDALVWPKPVEWACLLVGLVLVVRYRWLMDDAFVYFRYIDNFLFLKVGLVYNAGEYVEGFSSPGWLMILLLLRSLRVGFDVIVLGLGLVCYALFAYGLVVLNRRLAPSGSPVINLPLALTATNYSVMSYFTGGLETALLQPLAVAFGLFAVYPRSRFLQVVVALSPLVRHELILPALVALLVARRVPGAIRNLVCVSTVALGVWGLFRVDYYADLLPNTFYLKDEWMVLRGLGYLHHTLATYWLYLPAALLLALAIHLRRRGIEFEIRARLAMLVMLLPVLAYAVKVGGASVQYWYLAFPLCLAIAAGAGLAERAVHLWWPSGSLRSAPLTAGVVATLALWLHPPQLSHHPLHPEAEARPIGGVNDAQWHRRLLENRGDWAAATTPSQQEAFGSRRPFEYASVLRAGLCVDIYERYDRRIVHMFGLTDPILARVETEAHKPGHKRGLWPLAQDLTTLRRHAGALEPGGLSRAVEEGRAPSWVEHNLPALGVIEAKMYNRHRFLENLRLAIAPNLRLELDEETVGRLEKAEQDRREAARTRRARRRR